MTGHQRRAFSDRLRDLLEMLKEALNPRQPAPVPIPARDEPRRR